MANSQNRPLDAARRAEYGQYIDSQIEKTGRQVKLTEIFGGLFLLVVGLLVFFLAAAIIDHWIVPLRSLGRWGMLLLLVCGVATFVIFRLVPLVFRRVNPVYSAHTIERNAPAMKNSLLNHLVLRQDRQGVSRGVLRAVEQQAAQRLSQAPVDSAVDRGRLIRLGYLLVALMAAAALYKFFSPKDPLATFGRIAAPWSDVDAPTRVVIEQVRHSANPGSANPGNANPGAPGPDWVYADQKALEVEAVVRGLKSGEPVTLYWSTEDGRVDKQPIVMRPREDGRQFRCYLPEENIGLRQNVRFFVAAGDARSADFRIEVRTPPVIAVKSVEYRYPAYTHKRPETRVGGDITALVGTTCTLHAEANQEIKSGHVDLGCDGTIDAKLQVTGRRATATFQLAIDAQGNSPTSYLVRMANAEGHENPQPIRYNLEVLRDRPPTVKIVLPESRELQLPLNGSLPIVVQAADPDFALSSVHIYAALAESTSDVLLGAPILQEEVKEFTNADAPFDFRPDSKQLKGALKVGDTIHLWATARDNKHNPQDELEPNVLRDGPQEQPRLIVHVVAPTDQPRDKMQSKDPTDKKKPDPSSQEQPKDKQPSGGSDQKQTEKKKDDAKQGKEKGKEKGTEKSDEKQPGGADKKKSDDKQGNEKQEGGGAEKKEQSKSDGGPKDLSQLVDQIRREAEKEKQAKEKQPPDGSAGKQKGGGQSQPPPEGQKNPNDPSSQPGAGKKKSPADKSNPGGTGGSTDSETLPDPKTDGQQGTPSAGKTSDNVGRNQTGGEESPGGESTGGKDTASVKTPPSNPSDAKQTGAKEGAKGKAADDPSKQPGVTPKSNPDAVGNVGSAPNTSVGEKKSSETPKEKGGKQSPSSVPQEKSGTGNTADQSDNPNGTPKGLSDTKTKINNKEMPDQGPGQKQSGKEATAPSTDDKESNNKAKSGTKDGDKSGGTSPGGGQPGKAKGTGASGTHEEANGGEGAGKSAGTGETSTEGGEKVKSNTPTGASGSEKGNGSTTTEGNTNPGKAKSRPDTPPGGGSDTDSGSAGGDQRDPSGARGAPQTGPGAGKRHMEDTKPTDPDLEAAKKAADLVLDYIKDHPDEERFKEPRVIEMVNKLRAMRGAGDKNGPDGDVARQQLRGLSRSFSTRGMKSDGPSGVNEGRGARDLPGYSSEYLERSGTRPMRKSQ